MVETRRSTLRSLDGASQKVFTVEDPIEYEIADVNQIQVQSQIGLTFSSAFCLSMICSQNRFPLFGITL
jgi:type II secretory ATPase GspE/PulE/Tfp pilus assembly ATPase PilB-like protein